jgi:hypothetical protein
MKISDREQLRLSILRHLDAQAEASGRGMGERLLFEFIRAEGISDLSIENVQADLRYLEGKGLVSVDGKLISPEIRTWRITSAGRDEYALRNV